MHCWYLHRVSSQRDASTKGSDQFRGGPNQNSRHARTSCAKRVLMLPRCCCRLFRQRPWGCGVQSSYLPMIKRGYHKMGDKENKYQGCVRLSLPDRCNVSSPSQSSTIPRDVSSTKLSVCHVKRMAGVQFQLRATSSLPFS